MADTTFVSGTTISSSWLNGINDYVYTYADTPVARFKRLVVGHDLDSNISNNTDALSDYQQLVRYSTAYDNKVTYNAIGVQRYIKADTGARGGAFKAVTILGAEDGSTTPVNGDYQAESSLNITLNNYSDYLSGEVSGGAVSIGMTAEVRRYGAQGIIGLHVAASDMRVPANDTDLGGHTGVEAHSDGIGPDHRSANNGYGYRGTVKLRARTEETQPTWTKRGTAPFGNSTAVAKGAICLPKNATLTTYFTDPYFVCTQAGSTGLVDTCLDATTTPRATVNDGSVVWECRVGTEVGMGLFIANGSDNADSSQGYYRYGIVVDNGQYQGNSNEIDHAIYVNNSGTYNYQSYGDPSFHLYCFGVTNPAVMVLGSEDAAAGEQIASIQFKGFNSSDGAVQFASIVGYSLDDTATSEDGRVTFGVTVAGTGTPHLYLESGNVVAGDKAILGTTATTGFLHIGRCAGAPTGVPTVYAGKCPMVVDSTNGRLYVYHSSGWHYATLT